jgi:methylphosphotriester-DNA--protein-cysteine methyltransferase
MKQKSGPDKAPAEQVLKDIRRQTRRQYSAEEKIRIVLGGIAWIGEHLRVQRATERLAECSSVTTIAFELGYENASAFFAMFKAMRRGPLGNRFRRSKETWQAVDHCQS